MFLNMMRVRVGLAVTGILLVGMYFLGGGFGSGKSVIQIEFGMWPTELEGVQVSIDDEVVGTLKRFGNSFRTGFEVDDGKHTVKLLHPEIPCKPARVTSGAGGRTVLLIADFSETYRDGTTKPIIVLDY